MEPLPGECFHVVAGQCRLRFLLSGAKKQKDKIKKILNTKRDRQGALPHMTDKELEEEVIEVVGITSFVLPGKPESGSMSLVDKVRHVWDALAKPVVQSKKTGKQAVMKFGGWSLAEDKILLRRFKVTPKKWARIADHIDGRTGAQVRERWELLAQKKNGKTGQWDDSEDKKLKKL